MTTTNPYQPPQTAAAATPASPSAPSTAALWIGRVLSALPVLGLTMSAAMKFIQPGDMPKQFAQAGWDPKLLVPLGIVEIVSTILYVIPQTSVLGAILLTGYLGGAVATHVRINEGFAPPIIMGIMLWLGLLLRDARLPSLLPWRKL